jgi:imidazolonepropionase-like amidohydrolase
LRFIFWFAALLTADAVRAQPLAIMADRAYPSATADAVSDVTVIAIDTKITAVGKGLQIPAGAHVIRCEGCTILPGFWNAHVHFSEPKWLSAEAQPAARLAQQLEAMLTRSGFTTVVDTGSNPADTIPLRRRIDSGEIPGPRILTAGVPIYPPDGIPFYLKETLPPEILRLLSTPSDPAQAAAVVQANADAGADLLKLFTGSLVARDRVLPMPGPIARAAALAARERQLPVYAHPSDRAGVEVAIESGVNVLAHAPNVTRGIDDAFLKRAVKAGLAMVPTLKLFSDFANIAEVRNVVRRFRDAGGALLFGTDTGYLTDYDVAEEFRQLIATGLSAREILGMLTAEPVRRFSKDNELGRIAPDTIADLTIVEGDPLSEPTAFTRVRYTVRAGRVIYRMRQ